MDRQARLTPAQVQELAIDYTDCFDKSPEINLTRSNTDQNDLGDIDGKYVETAFKSSTPQAPQWGHNQANFTWELSGKTIMTNVCRLEFSIPDNIDPPVLFYYRLTNFYQNHRRYVKSLDMNQLKGDAVSANGIRSGECDPLAVASNGKPYYPCGLIANSMFNDTFEDFKALNAQGDDPDTYSFTNKGISWGSEGDLYGETKYKPEDVVPPLFWQDQFNNGSYEGLEKLPNLHEMEDFQVWMRTAGLPTFSKLAKRNNNDQLKIGRYRLDIWDRMVHSSHS